MTPEDDSPHADRKPDPDRRATPTRTRVAAAAVVAGLAVGAAMIFLGLHISDETPTTPPPSGLGTSVSKPTIGNEATAPNTLSLDPIGIDAPIVDATVPNGVLTPPDNVKNVGIWLDGAPLDSSTGTTLIVGHVNLAGQGNGALFDLVNVEPNQLIHTSDAAGKETAWRVTAVTTRPKAEGVEESVLAGPEGPRKLAVVTCGGELHFTHGLGDYSDNVYLYADPVN